MNSPGSMPNTAALETNTGTDFLRSVPREEQMKTTNKNKLVSDAFEIIRKSIDDDTAVRSAIEVIKWAVAEDGAVTAELIDRFVRSWSPGTGRMNEEFIRVIVSLILFSIRE